MIAKRANPTKMKGKNMLLAKYPEKRIEFIEPICKGSEYFDAYLNYIVSYVDKSF
jgi:hypothetical protein